MALTRLIIAAVRNVRHADINLSPGLNVLLGPNGSGKSSVLEAVHLLSQGKSFRAGNARQLISYGEKELAVSGSLQQVGGGGSRQIGISVSGSERRRRIDGCTSEGQAELAGLLPVIMLQPSSQILLESSPELRRQYLDWGAFQAFGADFLGCWRRYGKCLEQRNALLRGRIGAGLTTWEKELGRYGQELAGYRAEYLDRLAPFFAQSSARLAGGLGRLEAVYAQGWPANTDLIAYLAQTRDKDRRLGYTSVGPHRGDFRITVDGLSVRQVLSRGQSKLVVAALKMAQARLAQSVAAVENVCLLVDDLAAELDTANRQIFLNYLQDARLQALVTGTGADQFDSVGFGEGTAMFHVEHGVVTPV